MRKFNVLILVSTLFISNTFAQKTQVRDSDPFNQITVFGKLEVYIQAGAKEQIKLESEEVDLDDITTRTDGMELKISMSEKLMSNKKKAKIYITYKQVNKISANAGCEINTDDTLKLRKIELESLSGSSLYAYLKCDSLIGSVSSGALLSLQGNAGFVQVEVGSGSTYSGYDFPCKNASVKANSGGVVKVKASNLLEATSTTGGKVFYDGEPKEKKFKTVLGGKIKKAEE